jgi:transglutaminase-like putative cysteine protease
VLYLIEHETALRFAEPVREHQLELRLAPRDDAHQRLLALALELEPRAALREHRDCFGNRVHRASLPAPHDAIVVRLRAEVETLRANPFDWCPLRPEEEPAVLARALRESPRLLELVLHRSESVPELEPLRAALPSPPPERRAGAGLVADLQAAMAWAAASFAYDASATDAHAPLAVFLEKRAGVCQDFAHLLVALARGWGVPARYVSGYVEPTGAEGDQATHAWAEVLVPGAGWLGFDATHGLVVGDGYVPVAVGRDSRDAAPLRGAFKGDDPGAPPAVRLRVARQQQ